MGNTFGRLLTAMVTPFTADGEVDYKRAAELADMLVENGTEGIVVAGTTGESPTLTHDEEFKLFEVVKQTVSGRAAVIAGTGSNCTRTTIESTRMAEKIGVDAAMVVVPYYNKPSQEGLYQHFRTVAGATSLPMILYNIPGRTGINMLPDTVRRLAEIETIVGIKEASGNLEQVSTLVGTLPADFVVYSGDDAITLPMMELGAHGVISVAAHIAGKEMHAMIHGYAQGEQSKAWKAHEALMPLFNVLFITTNPAPVKAALSLCWKNVGGLRLPLIGVTDSERERISEVLKQLGKIHT